MRKVAAGLAMAVAMGGTPGWAASTDFGVRTVSMGSVLAEESGAAGLAAAGLSATRARIDLRSAAGIGSRWGRVTSTVRSVAHNRRVGGVRNSFHLSGRAIDIARRPGVSHAQIAAAFRNAGYYLIESLDEGDHSHFAFGSVPRMMMARAYKPAGQGNATQWRVVTAANAVLK